MPKKDYEKSIKGLHSIAHGVFIPIFFASIGIHFSYGSLSVPYYPVPVVLAIITFGKLGEQYWPQRSPSSSQSSLLPPA
jgi:Kef-type K+ transport system membrane component KefB